MPQPPHGAPFSRVFDDPALLGSVFSPPRSWRPWRTFGRTVFGERLTKSDLRLYRQCTGRLTPPRRAVNEVYAIVGRRGGKSRIASAIASYLASCRDYPGLAPGERATVMLLARDREQARILLNYVRGIFDSVPLFGRMISEEHTDGLRLSNRVAIEVHTAHVGAVRGYSLAAVIADEVAFWPGPRSSNPDTEILAALRPALMPGALLLGISSPYGPQGALWNTYRRNHGREDAGVLVWQADTRTMNPSFDPAKLEADFEEDPISAQTEYGAEFRRSVDAFVPPDVIENAITRGCRERPPVPRHEYHAFCDPSGGSTDAMALAIAHRDDDGGVTLDLVRRRCPPFQPSQVVAEWKLELRRYGITNVVGDHYGGDWVTERFQEHGFQYTASDRSKSRLYGELLPLLMEGKVRLLDDPVLVEELRHLERRPGRDRQDSIDHPHGGHDDVINAAAGALNVKPRPPLQIYAA